MVDHLTIHHLQVTLEQGLHHEGMANGGMGKLDGGSHILNIRKILLTYQNGAVFLLALQHIRPIPNLHGFLTIIIEPIEIQQRDLLTFIQ